MKKVRVAVVGVGNRGGVYADFAIQEPAQMEVVALVDTNSFKLEQAKAKYQVEDKNCFMSLDDFIKAKIDCDFVINATMDQLHLVTSLALLKARYNLLLEKPIVESRSKLKKIIDTARKFDCKICVCHVLRYTAFYKTIKELIVSGQIGEINSLQFNEHVWMVHFVNSYVRGKWRNQKECGSPFLLAKSCHDMDLICWLNNTTYPVRVFSFGSRNMFTKAKAPEGSTEYCYNCPCKKDCLYNAEFMEAKIDFFPKYTWKNIDKPYEQISMEEKLEYLKTDIMGECVYKTDMDICDRQTVSIEFANGSIASFNLVGGTTAIERNLHICGTKGEIIGSLGDNIIKLKTTNPVDCKPIETIIDPIKDHSDGREEVDSHFGGDYGIMSNVCAYFRGEQPSVSLTKIEDSINSHLVCYAAEKARKSSKIVKIKRL